MRYLAQAVSISRRQWESEWVFRFHPSHSSSQAYSASFCGSSLTAPPQSLGTDTQGVSIFEDFTLSAKTSISQFTPWSACVIQRFWLAREKRKLLANAYSS